MKTNIDATYWKEETDDGACWFGFTSAFLESIGEIWIFSTLEQTKVKLGQIYAQIESSRKLLSLKSPVSGTIVEWNPRAIDYPHKLTTNDRVFKVAT